MKSATNIPSVARSQPIESWRLGGSTEGCDGAKAEVVDRHDHYGGRAFGNLDLEARGGAGWHRSEAPPGARRRSDEHVQGRSCEE
jgi:hypothetical protein